VSAYEGPETPEAREERVRVGRGELPERYAEPWGRPFFAATRPALGAGASILDIGSGRRPTLPPSHRPDRCTYVGMDISADELNAAQDGDYDEIVVNDITEHLSELEEGFDLILSWQVLEHVSSLEAALRNMHSYLRPGGRAVALLSGRRAVFSVLARAIPYRISTRLMERFLGAEPEEKFPTTYDHCTASEIRPLLAGWSDYGIIPRFKGGGYFRFSRPLERVYLAYENWAAQARRPDLATHYVIWALK
jgi:SAM-dependent methyltransferase